MKAVWSNAWWNLTLLHQVSPRNNPSLKMTVVHFPSPVRTHTPSLHDRLSILQPLLLRMQKDSITIQAGIQYLRYQVWTVLFTFAKCLIGLSLLLVLAEFIKKWFQQIHFSLKSFLLLLWIQKSWSKCWNVSPQLTTTYIANHSQLGSCWWNPILWLIA